MLRKASAAVCPMGARSIVGAAPVLHLARAEATESRDAQIKKNTNIAVEMIKRFKGPLPAPYTRRHTKSFADVQKDVETLLGGASKMRRVVTDDQPMDKLSVMERCLRHAMWNYLKDEGNREFAEMEKWIVYTGSDETRLAQLKRQADLKDKYKAFKAKRAEKGGPQNFAPAFNWAEEYNNTLNRELVAEKRHRYDVVAANTTERNEGEIETLLGAYRKPQQERRLDELVDMLERFKPMLAREAIMQRLTVKHLEGQLGVWRYMDWMPEVRDRAELEADNYAQQWWLEWEEKRLLGIKLRSKNEVREVMEKKQMELAAKETKVVATGSKDNSARQKLLQEVIALQQRVNRKDDSAPAS